MTLRTLPIDERLMQYVLEHGAREHPAQAALREATRAHPHAGMQIGADQGRLMALLVKLIGARRTHRGRRVHRLQRARPWHWRCRADGHVLACDVSDEFTRIGKPFWQQAGVAHKIDLVLGPALDTLDARLAKGEAASYDFAFIDADKANYDGYYERCLQLLRTGGLIAFDNMLWGGAVARPAGDGDTRALQALNDKLQRRRARRHGAAHGGRRAGAGAQALIGRTPRFPCALRQPFWHSC